MSDLIKREDAIKALRCEYPTMPIFKGLREEWAIKTEGFRKAEEVIMNLPSADRPQGEWIRISPAKIYECSNCGQNVLTDDIGVYKWCHGCGARMKGADDGNK